MNGDILTKIGYWAEYVGAVARWVVVAIRDFPKKENYFGNGIRPVDTKDPD